MPPVTSSPSTTADATSTSSTSAPDPTTGSQDDSSGCATACDESDGPGDGFIAECDAGFALTHCSGGGGIECDPWQQNCPPGEKCQPWANDGGDDWNATRCTPVDPSGRQPGDPCLVEGNAVSGVDNCALGSLCWNVDPETNEGTCVAMCTGTPDLPVCDDPERACAQTNDGTLNVCLPSCDPLVGDCSDGEGCHPLAGDASLPMFVCAPTGNGIETHSGHATQCDPGTIDIDDRGLSSCARHEDPCCATVCDLDAPTCGDGLTCTPFYDDADLPPDLSDIGVCLG
jgi:hypothetical protein